MMAIRSAMDNDRKPNGMREAPATFVAATDQRHEVLAGLVERVTFHSTETGFCVLRVKARGHRDLVTTIGHAAMVSAGEWITASGTWLNDRNHGLQFKAHFLKTSAPSTIGGIEKYLGSGMIRGIGPTYAKRMVRLFGKDVFDIIEAAPERLREVEGIGPMRAAKITSAWADQKVIREIMVFLHEHGVGTARADCPARPDFVLHCPLFPQKFPMTITRNPFDTGGYSLAEMTQAINILPSLCTRLGRIGLFRFEGVTQRTIVI